MRGLLIFAAMAAAMTQQQADLARCIMKVVQVPEWSAITDSALHNHIAFTDQSTSKVWIDSKRMLKTPKTFANVLTHECSHLRMAMHGDGQLGMSYSVTLNSRGEIIDDNFLLLPELASHPFFANPLQACPVGNFSSYFSQ